MHRVSIHAFADESVRNDHYLLAVALVEPQDLRRLRTLMRSLLLPGQRELHLKAEKQARRRRLLDQVADSGAKVTIYTATCERRTQEAARGACIHRLVRDLVALQAHRLVLDSRSDRDRFDIRTIQRALGAYPAKTHLTYEHLDSVLEPLIWIADLAGWAQGAGGEWRRRTAPAITSVIECAAP